MSKDGFEKYVLGDAVIDSQHRRLFLAAHEILDLYQSKYDKAEMLTLVEKFKSLVEDHFKYEETLMFSNFFHVDQVLGYTKHLIEHQYTMSEINGFLLRQKVEFNEEFPIRYLSNILFQHILGPDKKFVNWLNNKQVKGVS